MADIGLFALAEETGFFYTIYMKKILYISLLLAACFGQGFAFGETPAEEIQEETLHPVFKQYIMDNITPLRPALKEIFDNNDILFFGEAHNYPTAQEEMRSQILEYNKTAAVKFTHLLS